MSIVVGYLSTAEGVEALEAASAEAERRQTEMIVVVSHRSDRKAGEDHAQREVDLSKAESRMSAAGLAYQLREIPVSTDVADDLVTVAEEANASLIVIGLRRRSPVGKLILGSNAQRILLDAPCPVLAVKPNRP